VAYKSGEFQIPQSQTFRAKAAAIFNNTLFVLHPSEGITANQITFDLSKLKKQNSSPNDDDPINDEALRNPANWFVKDLDMTATDSKPALVSFAGAMFCFVSGVDTRGLFASMYSLTDDNTVPGMWSQGISVLESDGHTAPMPRWSSDVSATTVGDNIIILACGYASSASNSGGGTYVAIYDTRDIDTTANKWVAKWHDYLPLQLSDLTATVHVSVEWFSTLAPDGQKTDPPTYNVAVFVQPELMMGDSSPANAEPLNMSFYTMAIGEPGGGDVSVTLTRNGSNPADLNVFYANLVRDPAGRLRSWVRRGGKSDYNAVLIQITPNVGMGFNPSAESITITDPTPGFPVGWPSSLFFVFTDGQSETPDGATQYPVYEFVFYGYNGMCQVNRCGTLEVIPDFTIRKTKEDLKKPLNVIAGIIDGPIPIPLENFKNLDARSDEKWGSMIYGLENSTGSSHKVSNTWSLGFETQGKMTAGVGPAWDISFKGGMGSVVGDSSETTTSYALTVETLIDAAKGNFNPTIVPDGALRSVGVQFSITAFRYLDNFGPDVDSTTNTPTDALKAVSVTPSMIDEDVLTFTPYMVTPGKLESYTPEAINATMKALGYTDTTNYFGDVIMTNAYPFTDPTNPYLSYSWAKDVISGRAFSQWAVSFQETSWNLDVHAYGGVSGASGASAFGEGAELEWEIMAGVDYSHDSISDADQKSGWSIGPSEQWGPPSREDLPESVSAYDFRVYLLPVPVDPSPLAKIKTYWTRELTSHATVPEVDGNSACWRIVYVVTRIEHVNGLNSYHYDGHLDVNRSVYKVGDGDERGNS